MPMNLETFTALLREIERNSKTIVTVVPEDKEIINIDLNTRKIELSKSSQYKDFLSVNEDHQAETLYFKCPRYFDGVDLMGTALVVEYTNANGNSFVAPIMVRDVTSQPGYIIFGWNIHGNATAAAGKIKFAFRFFTVDATAAELTYSLRTQATEGTILYGVDSSAITEEIKLGSTAFQALLEAVTEKSLVYWTNL